MSNRSIFRWKRTSWLWLAGVLALVALVATVAIPGATASASGQASGPLAAPPTPTPGPTPPPPPAGCSQALVNSDFEGNGGWIQYSSIAEPLITSFPPPSGAYHSGKRGAYLADYNNARDFIAQQVTIPANATKAVLQYWWQVETAESRVQAYDQLTLDVDIPLGSPVETLATISNQDAGARWNVSAHNLLRYRGRTITVRFEARTDANRPTAFYLDDVTLVVCVGTNMPYTVYVPLVSK